MMMLIGIVMFVVGVSEIEMPDVGANALLLMTIGMTLVGVGYANGK